MYTPYLRLAGSGNLNGVCDDAFGYLASLAHTSASTRRQLPRGGSRINRRRLSQFEAEEKNLNEERERAAADEDEGTSPWQHGGPPLKLMNRLIPG